MRHGNAFGGRIARWLGPERDDLGAWKARWMGPHRDRRGLRVLPGFRLIDSHPNDGGANCQDRHGDYGERSASHLRRRLDPSAVTRDCSCSPHDLRLPLSWRPGWLVRCAAIASGARSAFLRRTPAAGANAGRATFMAYSGRSSARDAKAGNRERVGAMKPPCKSANGAAPESNRPSLGLPDRTGFEDRLGHRALPLRRRS